MSDADEPTDEARELLAELVDAYWTFSRLMPTYDEATGLYEGGLTEDRIIKDRDDLIDDLMVEAAELLGIDHP